MSRLRSPPRIIQRTSRAFVHSPAHFVVWNSGTRRKVKSCSSTKIYANFVAEILTSPRFLFPKISHFPALKLPTAVDSLKNQSGRTGPTNRFFEREFLVALSNISTRHPQAGVHKTTTATTTALSTMYSRGLGLGDFVVLDGQGSELRLNEFNSCPVRERNFDDVRRCFLSSWRARSIRHAFLRMSSRVCCVCDLRRRRATGGGPCQLPWPVCATAVRVWPGKTVAADIFATLRFCTGKCKQRSVLIT